MIFIIAAWTTDPSQQMVIGSTIETPFQLQLPAGSDNISSVHIIIYIRDMLNAITEYDIQPIIVIPDMADIITLINILQQSNIEIINENSFIQLISGGTQNTIAQILTSLSQILNEMNNENIQTAISSANRNIYHKNIYLNSHFF
jgi:hypothetical protein